MRSWTVTGVVVVALMAGCGSQQPGTARPVAADLSTTQLAPSAAATTTPAAVTGSTPAVDSAAVEAAVAEAAALTAPELGEPVTAASERLTALVDAAAACLAYDADPSLVDYLINLNDALTVLQTAIADARRYVDGLEAAADAAADAGGGADPRVVQLGTSADTVTVAADDADTVLVEIATQADEAVSQPC